jgi:hypothetical protein
VPGTTAAPLTPTPPPPRRGLYELGQYAFLGTYKDSPGMNWSNFRDKDNGMTAVFVILIVEWFVFMGLAFYLEQVLSSGNGIRKHPLFFLDWCRGRGKQAAAKEEAAHNSIMVVRTGGCTCMQHRAQQQQAAQGPAATGSTGPSSNRHTACLVCGRRAACSGARCTSGGVAAPAGAQACLQWGRSWTLGSGILNGSARWMCAGSASTLCFRDPAESSVRSCAPCHVMTWRLRCCAAAGWRCRA